MRVHRLNRVMAVAAMAATAIIVTAPAAWAHPRLLSADPKPSTVAPGPVDHITVRFDEAVQWQYSTIGVEDTKGHSLLNGKPQTANREAVLPLQPGSSGALRVSWRLVGVDAHPVIGAYVFGIGTVSQAGHQAFELMSRSTNGGGSWSIPSVSSAACRNRSCTVRQEAS